MVQVDQLSDLAAPVRCPFEKCSENVELIEIRVRQDDPKPGLMIPNHVTTPGSWFGQCPASLMRHPPSMQAEELLAQQAAIYDRLALAHERANHPAGKGGVGEHIRQPHPTPDRGWFRWNLGGSSGQPLVAGPKLEPVSVPPSTSTGGNSMANVAEVVAAIEAANEVIADAQVLAKQAAEKFREAGQQLAAIQSTTGAALGAGQVNAAIENAETAYVLAHGAIETNNEYRVNL